MPRLSQGKKDPNVAAGAPFPPAVDHTDGPERPRRDVPTADATTEEHDEAEPNEEDDHDP